MTKHRIVNNYSATAQGMFRVMVQAKMDYIKAERAGLVSVEEVAALKARYDSLYGLMQEQFEKEEA